MKNKIKGLTKKILIPVIAGGMLTASGCLSNPTATRNMDALGQYGISSLVGSTVDQFARNVVNGFMYGNKNSNIYPLGTEWTNSQGVNFLKSPKGWVVKNKELTPTTLTDEIVFNANARENISEINYQDNKQNYSNENHSKRAYSVITDWEIKEKNNVLVCDEDKNKWIYYDKKGNEKNVAITQDGTMTFDSNGREIEIPSDAKTIFIK